MHFIKQCGFLPDIVRSETLDRDEVFLTYCNAVFWGVVLVKGLERFQKLVNIPHELLSSSPGQIFGDLSTYESEIIEKHC